ncbi:hypothetical protein [Tissierella sp.]|uniref:hypothetical protein n=1 Tax=Tissierella sp. TaxID=41274 RepID=UPI00302C371B
MNNAIRDGNKVSSILAADKELKTTIPLRANSDGSLIVSNVKNLKEVIRIDLGSSRDKVLFNKSFKEITIPVIDGEFTLYIDESVESKGLTINRALSIETTADRFYISNGSGKGKAEIWLWE